LGAKFAKHKFATADDPKDAKKKLLAAGPVQTAFSGADATMKTALPLFSFEYQIFAKAGKSRFPTTTTAVHQAFNAFGCQQQ
jgi:hypothetical protein